MVGLPIPLPYRLAPTSLATGAAGGATMPVVTTDTFVTALRKCGLLTAAQIDEHLAGLPADADPTAIARRFVKAGLLTKFQARCLAEGKGRSLIIANKYKLLDF